MADAEWSRRTLLPPSPFRPDLDFGSGDLWVFGYGSLMWDPGFPHLDMQAATVRGFHRAFCILSYFHRGTRERPGLVLGLDAGGACRGRAFRVAAALRDEVVDYLYRREMISGAYRPRLLSVRLADGSTAGALGFTANRRHPQYAGKLTPEQAAALVVQGVGLGGRCRDYLLNTIRHLDELGLGEGPLHRVRDLVLAMAPE